MEATSALTLLPSSKEERAVFVKRCIDEILEGNRNPIDVEIQLKSLEKVIKEIRENEQIKEAIQNEADKYSEKTFNFKGIEITKACKPTYNYSVCGHSEYNRLVKRKKELEEILKNSGKITIIDDETGQICDPPIITYSNYLKID